MTIDRAFEDLPRKFEEIESRDGILSHELNGKQIYFCERRGKEIHIVTYCGHAIVIQADVNGDIHFKCTNTTVIPPSVVLFGDPGKA